MKSIVVEKSMKSYFSIVESSDPLAKEGEVLIEVYASSINPGDLKYALEAEDGHIPGWDFSGIVISDSENEKFPKKGDRVMGILPYGAWSEIISVPVHSLALIPEGVSFEEAAVLPIVGLTALYSIKKANSLLNKNILISASTGSVGYISHQLAEISGGNHYGLVRQDSQKKSIKKLGAKEVLTYKELDKLDMKFDWIIDSLGGPYINQFLAYLNPNGTILSVGNVVSNQVNIDYSILLNYGGQKIERFFLGNEISSNNISKDLEYLGKLAENGKLILNITEKVEVEKINQIVTNFIEGKTTGKVILKFK
jgi:NADPH:quinone reductase